MKKGNRLDVFVFHVLTWSISCDINSLEGISKEAINE